MSPDFRPSARCVFPTRERENGLFKEKPSTKAVFPFPHGKNRISQGVENRGSLISVPLALREFPPQWHFKDNFKHFFSQRDSAKVGHAKILGGFCASTRWHFCLRILRRCPSFPEICQGACLAIFSFLTEAPLPDPTLTPPNTPKRTRNRPETEPNGAKQTRNGPKRSRKGPKSRPLGWDGRGVCRDGGGGGDYKGKRKSPALLMIGTLRPWYNAETPELPLNR